MCVAQLQLPIIIVAQLQLPDHHTCGTWMFTISECSLCRSACVGVIHLVLRREGVVVPWYFPSLCNSTTVSCFAGYSALWGCGGPLIPLRLCVTLPLEAVLQALHREGVVVCVTLPHRYLPICVTLSLLFYRPFCIVKVWWSIDTSPSV